METLIIGIMSSVLAAFIVFVFSQLFSFYSRKNININLEMAYDSLRQLEYALEYEDYNLLVSQADSLLQVLNNIEREIKVFTYLPTKKKFIRTILYSIRRFLQICKNMSVGYEGETENRARCNKIKRKYYYKLKNVQYSYLMFSIIIAQQMNRARSLNRAFLDLDDIRLLSKNQIKNVFDDLVPALFFKGDYVLKYDPIHYIFTNDEYKKFVDKIIKKIKNK